MRLLQSIGFIFSVLFISLVTWVFTLIALATIVIVISEIILRGRYGNEALFSQAVFVYAGSVLLSPIAIFPSYLLSMRLAVYLREKRGWEIRHPRRMFALAMLMLLALPILLLLLAPLTK